VELHEEAAAEYDAAFDWYLARSPDAALKFDAEFDHAVDRHCASSSALGRRSSSRYPQMLAAKVSVPFDLPGEVRRRNPDRGGRSHQPETWILERADLK
jgi:plasmid stabilization system protein ParE